MRLKCKNCDFTCREEAFSKTEIIDLDGTNLEEVTVYVCPNCVAIERRDEGKPCCPNCGAENSCLEYVATITEAASVEGVCGDSVVIMGDVYESYDPQFRHISCGACGTHWESEKEFADAYNKSKETQKKKG